MDTPALKLGDETGVVPLPALVEELLEGSDD